MTAGELVTIRMAADTGVWDCASTSSITPAVRIKRLHVGDEFVALVLDVGGVGCRSKLLTDEWCGWALVYDEDVVRP